MEGYTYSYIGPTVASQPDEQESVTLNFKNDVKQLKQGTLEANKAKNNPAEGVEQKATLEEQRYKDRKPKPSQVVRLDGNKETKEESAKAPLGEVGMPRRPKTAINW